VYAASLMAGERSGNLDEVIRRYVAYEKVIGAVRRRTISALIYPAILVTLMIVLIGIIVVKVSPAFSEFYSNFGRTLPLSTRIVVGLSNSSSGTCG
jgi:type IV pilus assembly protein PilC